MVSEKVSVSVSKNFGIKKNIGFKKFGIQKVLDSKNTFEEKISLKDIGIQKVLDFLIINWFCLTSPFYFFQILCARAQTRSIEHLFQVSR